MASEDEGLGPETGRQEPGEAPGMEAHAGEKIQKSRETLRQRALETPRPSQGTLRFDRAPRAAQIPLRSGTICLISTE